MCICNLLNPATVVLVMYLANIINFAFFQALWFSSVLGAAHGYTWAAPVCLAAFIIYHFKSHAKNKHADMLLVVLCVSFGLMLDTAGTISTWIEFTHYEFKPVAPLWLLCLWAGFALTVNHSMAWIQGRLLLSFIAGAVFGPLSYYAGWQAGAMQWLVPVYAAIFISLGWALVMPLLSITATHLKNERHGCQ